MNNPSLKFTRIDGTEFDVEVIPLEGEELSEAVIRTVKEVADREKQ